jgi:uncharacterized membrane protein
VASSTGSSVACMAVGRSVKRGHVASLLLAALFFDGIHFFISGTELRGKIVTLIGERRYQGLFSLMSLIGIVWLCRAYRQAEYFQLWENPRRFTRLL